MDKKLVLLLVLMFSSLGFGQILNPIFNSTAAPITTTVVGLLVPPGSNSNVNRYFSPIGAGATTEANVQIGSPVGGTITKIFCNSAVAPTAGGTNAMEFHIATVAKGTCTVTAGNHHTDSGALSNAVAKGDLINGKVTVLHDNSSMSMYVRVEGVTAGVTAFPLYTFSTYGASTRCWSASANSGNFTGVSLPFITGVTATNTEMYVGSPSAPTVSEAFDLIDVSSGGTCASPSGLIQTCTLSNPATHASCTGLSGAFTSGHLLTMRAVSNTATTTFGAYLRMEAASIPQMLPAIAAASLAASGSQAFSGGSFSQTGTAATDDANVSVGLPIGGTVTGISVLSSAAVAAGTSTYTLWINGASTAVTCGITSSTNSGFTNSCSGFSLAVNQGDLFSIVANNASGSAAFQGAILTIANPK